MQLTGRVTITVAGRRYKSKSGATIRNIEGYIRNGVAADTGVAGYQEETAIPEVEAIFVHDRTLSIMELAAITDATLSFDTDSGVSFVLRNSWYCAGSELSKEELKAKFQAIKAEEV